MSLNPLPRSVRRAGPLWLLDGDWRFELVTRDVGLVERWFERHDYRDRAVVPMSQRAATSPSAPPK
ncbi:MAG: hypothetical protein ABI401_13020 [Candidatus Dormibacter sp.]